MQRVAKHLYRRGDSYVFRRGIPEDVRDAFGGRREEFVTLGDIPKARAEALACVYGADITERIAKARGKYGPAQGNIRVVRVRRAPEREEIEKAVRAWLIEIEQRAPVAAMMSGAEVQQHVRDLGHLDADVVRVMRTGSGETPLMTRWIVDALIDAHGWSVPMVGPLRSFLEDRVARGQRELSARLRADLNWEDQPQPTHRMFAPHEFQRDREDMAKTPTHHCVPLMEVLEGYFAEQEPTSATVRKWNTAMKALIDYLGHDDAARVTGDDIVAWKNTLLTPDDSGARARSQMTVRHGYLGAVKPVFAWAVANKLIATNPVAGVHVSVPRRTRNRAERGYTDAEAKIVLQAANAIDCTLDRSFGAFARRWLPWLCAYTGARVGEMAQLRVQDIGEADDGIWFVIISPVAGRQKGGFTRQVALHPHLIELGFIEAVKGRSGPLFYDPALRREGSTGNHQSAKAAQRVAAWVRSLGLSDPELQPNHGWRHRFTSVARRTKIDPDIRRAILGHAAADEHQQYGDVTVQMIYEALETFPRLEWDESETHSGIAQIDT